MDKSLAEFIASKKTASPIRPADYGITVNEYAENQKMDASMASKILIELEAGGILQSQFMRYGGKRVRVYVKASDGKRTKP